MGKKFLSKFPDDLPQTIRDHQGLRGVCNAPLPQAPQSLQLVIPSAGAKVLQDS